MQFTLSDFSYTLFFLGSFIFSLYIVRKFFTDDLVNLKRRNVLMIGTSIFLLLVLMLTWLAPESIADYILTFYFTAFGVVFFETSRHKVEKSEELLSMKVNAYLALSEERKQQQKIIKAKRKKNKKNM
ncbi:MAG: hypothetical protein ACRC3A_06080 [Culicoidibacterales bacterium]